jgi:hypothetical protein
MHQAEDISLSSIIYFCIALENSFIYFNNLNVIFINSKSSSGDKWAAPY